MINVTPDHSIAHEAYEQVKNLHCDYVNIIAHTFQKSETEDGFFIAGIYPNTNKGGFNRLDWLTEFEQINQQSDENDFKTEKS